MVRAFVGLALFAFLSSATFGQTASPAPATPPAADTPPAFEIADVHTSPHSNSPSMRGGRLRGDRYFLREATMTDLIAEANFSLRANGFESRYVLSGPSWLDLDRFDVSAKAPRNTSPETVSLMLHTLLTDRFKLVTHSDTKILPAFLLTAPKGPSKLKQADDSRPKGCRYQQPAKETTSPGLTNITFSCHNTTMQAFAEFLYETASPYLKNPVVDSTGIKGAWDFDIHWSYQVPKPDSDGITIFDAVEKQLGLKLEAKTAPLPVVIVDSVNEKPTPNPPGVDKALPPPPPAEFEVAVIRPSDPSAKNMGIQFDGSGKITVQGATLEDLISFAWDINTAMTVGAPGWLDRDRWDILGKATSDAPAIGGGGASLDIDDLKQMLRNLLAERFKLATHTEDRPYDAYTLVAANPKMKKADPINRTGCKTGPGADGKDPRITNPNLGRLVTCLNMTMPQFADQLQSMASGYIKSPVLDATGIEGAYDFTLSFSTTNQLRASQRAATTDSSGAPSASDPSGAISLLDALPKEIGVKLEKSKRPVAMLVIDHVDEKPTEN